MSIIDPITGEPRAELAFAAEPEPEILNGRRAFPMAQFLMAGSPFGAARTLTASWHDTSVNDETGAFAVVDIDGANEDLIGEVVRVTIADRSVHCYVLQASDVAVGISLARRAWVAVARLSYETVSASVVVVR